MNARLLPADIDTMLAGREMDAWVQEKIFGLITLRASPSIFTDIYDADSWLTSIPYYSTDIAAAWQVIERLKNEYRMSLLEEIKGLTELLGDSLSDDTPCFEILSQGFN